MQEAQCVDDSKGTPQKNNTSTQRKENGVKAHYGATALARTPEILLPTSSTPAVAAARVASNRAAIEGLLPNETLDARTGKGAPARGTVAAFCGTLAAEGKRDPSVFLRKGLGRSSSS